MAEISPLTATTPQHTTPHGNTSSPHQQGNAGFGLGHVNPSSASVQLLSGSVCGISTLGIKSMAMTASPCQFHQYTMTAFSSSNVFMHLSPTTHCSNTGVGSGDMAQYMTPTFPRNTSGVPPTSIPVMPQHNYTNNVAFWKVGIGHKVPKQAINIRNQLLR